MTHSFWRHFTSRIRYKIIAPYLLLALLGVILLGILTFYTIANRLQKQLDNELRISATKTAQSLESFEETLLEQMNLIATQDANPTRGISSTTDLFVNRNAPQLQGLLESAINFYGDVYLILALDTNGEVIAQATSPAGTSIPSFTGENKDRLAEQPLVQNVLNGVTDEIGDKYASIINIGSSDGSTDSVPYFYIVAPIKQQVQGSTSERVVGALIFADPLSRVLERLEQRNEVALVAVLDGGGNVLNVTPPIVNDQLPLTSEQIATLRNAPDRTLISQLQIDNKPFQVVYSPLRIRRSIDGFFAVAQPRDFITQTWAESRIWVSLIGIGLVLGVILVGVLVTGRITAPLGELTSTALAVKGGQLERRSTVASRDDEVGTLASVLNEMTDRLFDLYRTSRQMGAQLSVSGVLQATAAAVDRLIPSHHLAALIRANGEWMRYTIDEEYEIQAPVLPERLRDLAPVIDLDQEQELHDALTELDTEAWVALPLRTQQQGIGLLLITTAPDRPELLPIAEPLTAIASMAATAIQNALLYSTVQDEASRKQAILQSIADGVVVLDGDGQVMLVNNTAAQMLKVPVEQLLDRTFEQLPLTPVQEGPEIFSAERRSAMPHLYESHGRIISLSSAPVRRSEGEQTGEVLVLHDVTAEREIDRAKTDFIATISHELRTPLTPIKSYTDMLLRGYAGELSDDQREFLNVIDNKVKVMINFTDKVTTMASIETGETPFNNRPFPVDPVLEQAVGIMQAAIEKKGLTLQKDIAEDLPVATIDPDLLKNALVELLDNARIYTTEGTITVRASQDQDLVRIDISDTGKGISEEDLGRLFTRFRRGGEQSGLASQERGAGLGLAIARLLIEGMGGHIWVRSEVGVGSTFSIGLPYVSDEQLHSSEHHITTTG